MTSIIASAVSNLSATSWVDVVALAVVLVFACVGAIRGFSDTISSLVGVVVACLGFKSVLGALKGIVPKWQFAASHQILGAVVVFVAAVVVCIVIFQFIRLILGKIIKLAVRQPFDAILGGLSGFVKAFVVLAIIHAGVSLLPKDSSARKAVERTRTVRMVSFTAGLFPHGGK